MTLNDDTRVRHYLAGVTALDNVTFLVSPPTEGVVVSRKSNFASYFQTVTRRQSVPRLPTEQDRRLFHRYAKPLISTLRDEKLRGQVLLVIGDNRKGFETPTIVKSRPVGSPNRSVLFPLNANRHFLPMHKVSDADIPFEAKAARIVWRGGTTGRLLAAPGQAGSRIHIFDWIDRHPRIDVGFSHKTPAVAAAKGEILQRLDAGLRPPMTQAEQLRSRYLLSLEGNDVASGLKWMLLSNSVVLMPPPTMETWACEAFLKPMVHYVPVAPDLSDLEERLDWCESNLSVIRAIADAGGQFAKMFLDEEREDRLRRLVATEYTSRVLLLSAAHA